MKIVLLPLDERPCNYSYPSYLPMDEEITLELPPIDILSKKKVQADFDLLDKWLLDAIKEASYLIISLDTFLYGGIIPSRLHHFSVETIKKRCEILKSFKKINSSLKIYANELIMRCPAYSLSVEEPDYFDECGFEIWQHGVYLDKISRGELTSEEEVLMKENKAKIKDEYLDDLLTRRNVNKEIIKNNLLLLKSKYIDFLSIPQDDCAPYGFAMIDKRDINNFIKENNISNVMTYPGADDVGLDLISRVLNNYYSYSPKVYLHYANEKGKNAIPDYEDRPLDETVTLHLSVAGCKIVNSLRDADIAYIVNCDESFDSNRELTLNKNFKGVIETINYAISDHKYVAIADSAYANRGDFALFKALKDNDLLNRINAYAGWNTNSNTLGTVNAMIVSSFYCKNKNKQSRMLFSRYVEDLLYMGLVRDELMNKIKSAGKNIHNILEDEPEHIKFVKERLLEEIALKGIDKIYSFKDIEISFPWHRTFEICLEVK